VVYLFKQALLVLIIAAVVFSAACTDRISQRTVKGAPEGSAFQLSAANADAAEPAIAGVKGSNDEVYAVWVEHHEKNADVMLARMRLDGKPTPPAVRVNPIVGEATAWRGDPPTITVASDGTVYVGWTSRLEASESQHATTLYLSASRDGGKTFTPPVKVNDDAQPAVHGMHSLTVGANGRVYLAWLDERNIIHPQSSSTAGGHHMESNREVFLTFSDDGGQTFSANRLIATNACPCCKTAIATGPDNQVYLSWRQVLPGDFRHIAVASSNDRGQTFGKPVIVSDDQWMLAGCPVSGPGLSVARDGTLNVLWYSGGKNGQTGLYWSASNDSGSKFTPRVMVASGNTNGTPVLVANATSLNAIWEASGSKLVTSELDQSKQIESGIELTSGELPAAVRVNNTLVIAYVTKVDEHRSIWVRTSFF
jgi:hypothetical protein